MEITPQLVSDCESFSDLAIRIGKTAHSRTLKALRKELIDRRISFSHFRKNGNRLIKRIKKNCPICQKEFESKENAEQVTCSYSCSNTYFARKRNKPERYKNYKTICFHHHKKECVVCGENRIVEVHHMDEDHENNDPMNLVPLCPTHHQYWHSRYRELIFDKINQYVMLISERFNKYSL